MKSLDPLCWKRSVDACHIALSYSRVVAALGACVVTGNSARRSVDVVGIGSKQFVGAVGMAADGLPEAVCQSSTSHVGLNEIMLDHRHSRVE